MSLAQRMKKHRKELRTLADIADSKVFLVLDSNGKNINTQRIPGTCGSTLSVLHAWNTPSPWDGSPVIGVSRKALLQDISYKLVESDVDFICMHDTKSDQTRIPFTSMGCVYTGDEENLAKARKTDRNYILIEACRQMLLWDVNPAEQRLVRMASESDILDTFEIRNIPDFDLDVIEMGTSVLTEGDARFIACTSRLGQSPFALATSRFASRTEEHGLYQVEPALQLILSSDLDFVLVDGGVLPLSLKGAVIADLELGDTGTKTWVDKVNEVGEFDVRLQGIRTLAALFGVETEITVLDSAASDSGTSVSDAGPDSVPAEALIG